jgi:hypothetical protein
VDASKELEWANLDILLPNFSLYETETFNMCFMLLYPAPADGRVPWFTCELNYSSFLFAWKCCNGTHVIRHPDATVTVYFEGRVTKDDKESSSPRVGVFHVKNVRCSPPLPEALVIERRHKIVCLAAPSAVYLGRAQRIQTNDSGKDRVYEWKCSEQDTRPFSGVPLWQKEDRDLRLETHRDLVRLRVELPYSARHATNGVSDFVPDNDEFSNSAISPLPIVCGSDSAVTFKFFNLGQADERAACSNAAEVSVRPKDFYTVPTVAAVAETSYTLLSKSSYKRRSSMKSNVVLSKKEDLIFSSRLTLDLTVEVQGTRLKNNDVSIVSVKLFAKNYHYSLKFTPIHPPMSV